MMHQRIYIDHIISIQDHHIVVISDIYRHRHAIAGHMGSDHADDDDVAVGAGRAGMN